jgi:hypothetical protein
LSDSQVEALEVGRSLRLTPQQRRRLLAARGGPPPSELLVYFTARGENDCTCGIFDVALRFEARRFEVPHEYLVDDDEAARIEAAWGGGR